MRPRVHPFQYPSQAHTTGVESRSRLVPRTKEKNNATLNPVRHLMPRSHDAVLVVVLFFFFFSPFLLSLHSRTGDLAFPLKLSKFVLTGLIIEAP